MNIETKKSQILNFFGKKVLILTRINLEEGFRKFTAKINDKI